MEGRKYALIVVGKDRRDVREFLDFECAVEHYWNEIGYYVWKHIRSGDFDVTVWKADNKPIQEVIYEKYGNVKAYILQTVLIEGVELYISLAVIEGD